MIKKYTSSAAEKAVAPQRCKHSPCCDKLCNIQEYDPQIKLKVEGVIKSRSKAEIKQSLVNHLYSQEKMGITTHGFLFGGRFFCPKFFSEFSHVSPYLIQEVFKAFAADQKHFSHGNKVGLRETNATIGCICWIKRFAENFGNYAPDEKVIVISACFTVKEIYMVYKAESPAPQVSKSSFYELLKTRFGPRRADQTLPWIRVSSYSTHSRCDQCLLLEKFQRSCQSEEDLAMAKSLKQEHKQVYVKARISIEDKRLKALSDPNNHVFIQVDDMDNHKVFAVN